MDACSHQAEPSTPLKGLSEATPGDPRVAIQPLVVSGLVVGTAGQGPRGTPALRPYLPQLVAIEPLGSGQFLLRLAGDAPEDNGFKE